MKRLFIAILIAVFIISFGFFEKSRVFSVCNALEGNINTCISLYETDIEKCAMECDKLKLDWSEKLAGATLYLNHEFIDEISKILAALPIYAINSNDSDFFASCEQIKQILKTIKRDQTITADSFY